MKGVHKDAHFVFDLVYAACTIHFVVFPGFPVEIYNSLCLSVISGYARFDDLHVRIICTAFNRSPVLYALCND